MHFNLPYFAGITSGSLSSAASLGEELLSRGFVEQVVFWWEDPITFCSRGEPFELCERRILMITNIMITIIVNAAPISIPRSGEMARSPSEAVNNRKIISSHLHRKLYSCYNRTQALARRAISSKSLELIKLWDN